MPRVSALVLACMLGAGAVAVTQEDTSVSDHAHHAPPLRCAVTPLLVTITTKQCGQKWADTETTTALWRAISEGDKEALETLLDADEENAHVRAADGRGPLWYVAKHL